MAATKILLLLVGPASCLTWLGISDVHFGHDVVTKNGTVTTSLSLNIQAVAELNSLALNATWPASLGGGVVQPPRGVILSGDIVDNGFTQAYELLNFTRVYGLNGSDGMLRYPICEGRGNHDGGNTTDTEPHPVASLIVARNQARLAAPSIFALTNVSATGLHYSWAWPLLPAAAASGGGGGAPPPCAAHFVMLNEYAGHLCDGCAPAPSCFYGKACYTGWTYPEDSLGFLEATLARVVGSSGQPVFVIQHYCFDGYSDAWWSGAQRAELYATLRKYNTVGVICGHTHQAAVYEWNGTDTGGSLAGGITVYNVPSTQKEDADGFGEPSEFMAFSMEAAGGGAGVIRAGQRVGYEWGQVALKKAFTAPCLA